MMHQSKALGKTIIATSAVCFCLFVFTTAGLSGEGHNQETMKESEGQHAKNNHAPEQRIIFGTVEGVNENTIKVNAGEVGEMSPRHLELEKLGKKADSVKQGNRLKITVNNKNKIVDYQLADEKN